MAVARFNIAVRFQHENNDAWQTSPIARLTRDGQGGWAIDRTFIPLHDAIFSKPRITGTVSVAESPNTLPLPTTDVHAP